MKIFNFLILSLPLAFVNAHYECTEEQAFELLLKNATVVVSEQLLSALRNGAAELRGEVSQTDAKQAANAIIKYYSKVFEIA
ncbi:hypothetical protein GGI26_002526 [Coemansia sp. RSA 1358]|uniref:Uncharacterized protein n=1 Tax=Coemansia umbellata TaxID=1424467 RepID=A0ABQ8PNC9_9FUNG|nr:hypothetical protein EDC05_002653 [Coemansia umbellata]KAJ2623298.1 hypothetical protein GGI26_002526 [Coemansia sp. RSA 1358]